MIRACTEKDFNTIYDIINEAATAYRDVIPADCWKEPYMPREELEEEISRGVEFWGYEDNGRLVGIMGIQNKGEVILFRHAYVYSDYQKKGIGSKLLVHLRGMADRPVLIGTWADAYWAIRFYEKHYFQLVSLEEKNRLLKKYWSIPDRQVETSVVLRENPDMIKE